MNAAPDGSSGLGGDDAGGASDAGDAAGDAGSIGDAASAVDTGGATDVASLGDANVPDKDACTPGSPIAFPGAVGFGAAATGGRGSAAYT